MGFFMPLFLKFWITLAFTEGFTSHPITSEGFGDEGFISEPFASDHMRSLPTPQIIRHILLLSLIIVKLISDNNYGPFNSHT